MELDVYKRQLFGLIAERLFTEDDFDENGMRKDCLLYTSGIDYVHYFNMRNWTGWVTNYSGIYKDVYKRQILLSYVIVTALP